MMRNLYSVPNEDIGKQNGTGNHYIDGLQVRDGNNVVHQWNFTGSAPTKTVP